MKYKKILIAIIVITLLIISAIWGYYLYQNSTIKKVVKRYEGNIILEQIEIDDNTFVIFDTGDFIKGGFFKRGIFGWKAITISQAIDGKGRDVSFGTDYYAYTTNKEIGFYFGYVNPNKVETVRFQYNGLDIKHRVQSYHWFIPVFEDKGSFKANQFSIILKDGQEVFYPFNELE